MPTRSLNKVMLIGNLTRDPNLRYTPTNNTPVCSFGVATNRDWLDSTSNERQDQAEFHNIVAWSKLAEICTNLLHKGDKVYVDGRLQTREWKGEDGISRRTTEIIIDNMILLRGAGSSREAMGGGEPVEALGSDELEPAPARASGRTKAKAQESEAPVETVEEVTEVEDLSDDIPF
jgi:single-strand DNA-binding protein